MKVFIVLVLFSYFSFSALAESFSSSQSINFDSSNGDSKYSILKNAYENATVPASLDDFENFEENEADRSQECRQVMKEEPNKFYDVILAIVEKMIPGTPGDGPLFPGTEDKIIKKALHGGVWIGDTKYFDLFKNDETDSDFVIHLIKNNRKVYSDVGSNIYIKIRKTGNYLPYIVEKKIKNKMTVLGYGYCYKKY